MSRNRSGNKSVEDRTFFSMMLSETEAKEIIEYFTDQYGRVWAPVLETFINRLKNKVEWEGTVQPLGAKPEPTPEEYGDLDHIPARSLREVPVNA